MTAATSVKGKFIGNPYKTFDFNIDANRNLKQFIKIRIQEKSFKKFKLTLIAFENTRE